MPVKAGDIQFFHCQAPGMGGLIDLDNPYDPSVREHLFDDVGAQEAYDGSETYRCLYVVNASGTSDLMNARAWIEHASGSPHTSFLLGVGIAPHGSPEPIVADEHTPPVGVTFEKAHKPSSGIDIGNLLRNGDFVALWVKRMVAPNADSIVNDVYSIRLIGETA